ncbi:hypothetical protein FSARC_13852 [Fusarium sarcochroum]|uniref:Uncharacterized protein n=1 Tax=Fusarium sarcochroum TaxID=1208366 RepID=A0A8H4WSA5_9HYPO|nr:hypothetical protein FSARC_13852 [Fusarium sarcochroum]
MVPPRRSPYHRVEAGVFVWERHDQQGQARGTNQELSMVRGAFHDYGYGVRSIPIPVNARSRSQFPVALQNKLVNLASASTLIILYYQGNAGLDRHGHLVLSNGNGQRMHWSDVVNAIIPVRCDVLAILNCHHAGAAVRSCVRSRPNYEGHDKQVMMAVPANMRTHWNSGAGFAACLEQALRDRRRNWENNFKGTPGHWAQAINRTIGMKSGSAGQVSVDHLIRPPTQAAQRPIVLGPKTGC